MSLVSELCGWFARNQRDLPWRHSRDPYAIWISEAMLQQTRVETVIPYYTRFLERLPTVTALADASEDEVVALWSGLGYYRRARALRDAAECIVRDHGGVVPGTHAEFLALPGVGPYTAGAVLSIAFGRSEAVVDGNVTRVFCRLFGYDEEPGSALQRKLWSVARELVPKRSDSKRCRANGVSPGAWNQALMELGALVCTSTTPSCGECPLRARCVAYRDGLVAELPRRAARRAPIDVRVEVLVSRRDQLVLIVRRPRIGRMSRMWELPTRELPDSEGRTYLWPASHAFELRAGKRELHSVSHSITHHRIRASVHDAEPPRRTDGGGVEVRWAHIEELENVGLTGLSRKVLGGVF